jgi:mediator of RNA polymerase II transcription subunit 12
VLPLIHTANNQKLDSICADSNMTDVCKAFFSGNTAPNSTNLDFTRLEEKLFILLNWAMGLYHLGAHRPYAVYTLLRIWLERFDKHQSASPWPKTMDFFPLVYRWLDTSHAAHKADNIPAIGITIGELTRSGLFHYGRYLQTLIAQGHTARSRKGDTPSHHLGLLRVIPIFVQANDLLQQRRIALSGDDPEVQRIDEEEEGAAMAVWKELVREYVPEVFGQSEWSRGGADFRTV